MAEPLKIIPQGRAPDLMLGFERDGKIWAYVVPADNQKQACFDAMREIAETWKKATKIPATRAKKRAKL